jgi:hypothetical protein
MVSHPFQSFLKRLNDPRERRRRILRTGRNGRHANALGRPSNWGSAAETLEDRSLLAATAFGALPVATTHAESTPVTKQVAPSPSPLTSTVTWTGGAGTTHWTDAANWSTGAVPGAGDDVVINVATATTIQIYSATVSVNSVTTNAQISVDTGTSLTTPTLNASANILMEGGTIANTVINLSSSSALVGGGFAGTLNDVTTNGTVDMSSNPSTFNVIGGLTLNNATVLMGNMAGTTYGIFDFLGSETLGGTGSIIFGSSVNNGLAVIGNAAT